jgi:uncharacterized protein YndB with AHSA1/START domain
MENEVSFEYAIYIGAPASKVWKGLVDGEITKRYVYGTRFESKLNEGDAYAYLGEGDFKVVEGRVLKIEKESRIVLSWKANYDKAVAQEEPSRVAFELTSSGPSTTRLSLIHDGFQTPSAGYAGAREGWPLMLSSLKSILETGRALEVK